MSFQMRLGIIGCGAVTEFSYLPALKEIKIIRLIALVDKDIKLARRLAQAYDIDIVEENYEELVGKVDAVIIALPNWLHHQVTVFFLKNKIHVLCEKPMATNVRDCDEMIKVAENNKCKLAIGHVRRFFYSSQLIKKIIDNGWIGEVRNFTLKEGGPYNWPTTSAFYFDPVKAGGGVLMDTGPHVLDLLLWWFGEPEKIYYFDDNFDGVEANCILKINKQNNKEALVKLSRLITLDNLFTIEGIKGTVKARSFGFDKVTIFLKGMGQFELGKAEKTNILYYFKLQVTNFIESITQNITPMVNGYEGKKVIQLIEQCYKQREPIKMPWLLKEKEL